MGTTATAVTKLSTAAASRQVKILKNLFSQAAHAEIALAYALHSFYASDMHKILGYNVYESVTMFDVSYSHVNRLRRIATHAIRLGYTQEQMEKVHAKVGHLSAMAQYLQELETKVSVPQMVKDLRSYHSGPNTMQLHIHMDKKDGARVMKALKEHGMYVDPETGRRSNATDALVSLVDSLRK